MSSELDRCYVAALRILGYRFNSSSELRRKLTAKKFERDVIDETLARLRQEKWLDDGRFAAAYVRTRLAKRIGKLRIRRELIAAGVDDDAINRAMRENIDDEREVGNLAEVLEKKVRTLARRYGDDYAASAEGQAKLAAYLMRHGFDGDSVRIAIQRLRK